MKLFLLFPLLLLTSCSLFKKDAPKEKGEEKVTGPERRIVGRIAAVSQAGEFVLIQKFGAGTLPEEIIYQSQGPEGRSASLRPSGERVRDFFAADLLSGEVEKGDAVVAYPDPKKKEEKPPQEIESSFPPLKIKLSEEENKKAPPDGQDPKTIKTSG